MATARNFGITGFGGYVPRLRMPRATIAAAHQWMAPGLRAQAKGQRAFCSWDEDAVTMAVEAARDALGDRPRDTFASLAMVTTTSPFADMQSSAIVARALGLPDAVRTQDLGSSHRAGVGGLIAALRAADGPGLFIATERPRGKPASVQEIGVGAGASAFSLGSDAIVASMLGSASRTAMFVDHFRAAGAHYDYYWEERWIRDEGYLKLVVKTVAAAMKDAGIATADVKRFILPAAFRGIAAAVAGRLGIDPSAEAKPLDDNCGYTGAAHGLLMLSHALEQAAPGDVIVLACLGQGVDALVLRATDAIETFRPRRGVSGALADAQVQDAYLRLLSYEGAVDLEWGMRAEKPVKTALTEQYRSNDQLASFVAGKCRKCNTIQFPQLPYCVNPACCAPRSNFDAYPLFDEAAQVLTYTADWLSYHPAPPLYVGFVQFEHGARLLMEMVDIGKDGLDPGTPMRTVFRIKDVDKARGYPRYFWKATPLKA